MHSKNSGVRIPLQLQNGGCREGISKRPLSYMQLSAFNDGMFK